MKITSKEFKDKGKMPKQFTADGENINPELIISEIPKDTKSLILICDDPDAQKVCGFTWIHWVIFNIPVTKDTLTIKQNSLPGTPGDSTYHKEKYGGPNPPANSGTHNYYFKILALSDKLNLEPMTPLNQILNKSKNLIIDKCEIIGTYSRD